MCAAAGALGALGWGVVGVSAEGVGGREAAAEGARTVTGAGGARTAAAWAATGAGAGAAVGAGGVEAGGVGWGTEATCIQSILTQDYYDSLVGYGEWLTRMPGTDICRMRAVNTEHESNARMSRVKSNFNVIWKGYHSSMTSTAVMAISKGCIAKVLVHACASLFRIVANAALTLQADMATCKDVQTC